ncbi:hypothetical protein G1K73_05090 [Tenacibaculum finnmarkense]|uniref:restriction endonuclease subunit S n=1 Tax=Tenacibaculum finnmarkense TaxID=2781243 RepID=UPI001EFA413E|nr:restriction endonuclease subunit S [Tenacibaculum finnmarkense]MCG8893134.1 hypothetical protein [Tenacibaculum finnmarkense]
MSLSIKNIPSDWEFVKLSELTIVITKGTTPTTNGFSYLKNGVNFVKVESIHSNGTFIPSKFAYVGNNCHNSFKRSQLYKDDILFTIAGALGRSAIVEKNILPANTNQAVAIIRLKNLDNKDYIFHYLRGNSIKKLIERINVSTAQANLSLGQINNFNIPLPPLQEQQKIAEILSTVDAKISIIDEQISETQNLKKGLMQSLLSKGIGHTEFKKSALGEIPKSWEVAELSELTIVITKGTTPTTNGFSYLKNGVNFVKVESIHSNGTFIPSKFAYVGNDCHNSFKRSQLYKDDILFTIAGALGRSAIVEKYILPANTNQAVAIIRLKNLDNKDYIFHYLRGNSIKKLIERINVSTAQANLSLGQINNFNIPLPPLKEQQKISEILNSVDEKLGVLSEKKSYYQNLKKGLMQQLLTGLVRVSV